jgi:hypothetical protein
MYKNKNFMIKIGTWPLSEGLVWDFVRPDDHDHSDLNQEEYQLVIDSLEEIRAKILNFCLKKGIDIKTSLTDK